MTTLSGGEKARVALARALATQAPVLLADEPTAALDPRHQLVVMELLRQAARGGNAVLAIMHDLTLAARFADRVLVMDRGAIVADGTPAEALSAERLAAVFGIEAATVEVGDKRVPIAGRALVGLAHVRPDRPQRHAARWPQRPRYRDPRRQDRGGRARDRWRSRAAPSTRRACLVSPPFIDVHFHMDATLSLGLPRLNQSGTLLEGIALWGELKPLLTPEAVAERALRYCDLAVAQGLLAIRSHVDICDDRLTAVDALLDVKQKIAPYIDLQLVAFPQDGYFRSPRRRRKISTARSTRASTWSAAFRISSARWKTARARSRCCATSRPSAA